MFRVRDDASKGEVKEAVELMFEVKVEGVNLLNKPGKTRRFKNVAGKRNGYKKAYVSLATGQSIDFTGGTRSKGPSHGTHQNEADVPGHALRRQDRPLAPAQGRAARVADDQEEPHRRAQPLRPHTTRHIGGGHKQRYRIVDFKRDKDGIPGVVERLEYDPNRTSHLALVLYKDGERRYILAPKGVKAGDEIRSGADAPIKAGQRAAAAPHPGRLHRAQHRAEGRQGRPAGAQRRRLGPVRRARRRVRAACA